MASDGKITIDFDLNDKASEKLDEFTKKAGKTGEDSKEKMEKPFKDPITAKLVAQAKKEGISNFRSLLKEIPEKQKTDLLARAKKGEAIDFQKELKKIPNKVLSKVELNDNASSGLRKLQQESKKTEISFGSLKNIIKGTFAGNLAFQAASKGVQLVTGAVGDAIKRVDTLNNSNRAYENMGIKASDAAEANKMLQKSIDGLPTALDAATRSQQLLTSSMNNDVKGATDVFRALNDGILGFGGSAQQVDEAVLQVSQSFSNGKVDAQTWNSMLNAQLGPTLNALAKQMGKTTGQLKDGLSDGSISVEQFQQGLINLDKNGGGGLKSLQKIAKDSTSGIGTSMQNVKTAIVRGVGNVVEGLQKAGLSKILDGMRNSIDSLKGPATKLGETLGGLMNFVVQLIAPLSDIIKTLGLSAWKVVSTVIGDISGAFKDLGNQLGFTKDKGNPVVNVLKDIAGHKGAIEALGTAIGIVASGMLVYKGAMTAAKVATSLWSGVTKVATGVQWALNAALNANPIGLIITAVALLAVGFYELYKHCKPFREFVDNFLKGAGKVFSDFGKNAGKALKDVGKWFGGIGKSISGGLSSAGKAVSSFVSGIGKWFGGVFKAMVKPFKQVLDFYVNFWKTVGKVFVYGIALIVGIFVLLGESILKKVKSFIDPIVKVFQSMFKPISKAWNAGWKAISKTFSNVWKSISKTFSNVWKAISSTFKNVWKGIKKFFDPIIKWLVDFFITRIDNLKKNFGIAFNFIENVFTSTWKNIKKFFKPIIKWLSDVIEDTLGFISKTWNSTWDGISSFFGGIWKWLTKTTDSSIKGIQKVISGVLDTISGVWNGMWSGLGSFFGDIWDGIKQTAANGINFVIDVINSGVDAIDKVWKFFSGHETSIKHLKHVKFANGGTVGEEQMAMINDGGGSNWKELLEFPDGSVGMSEKRNHVLPLPTGTRVYNGEETKTIMEKAGIKKYANGGIVGSVIGAAKGAVDWTVDTAKGVGEWVGDKYNAVVKFLKDPLKNVTNMITGAISGITKKMGNFADFATGAWKNMYSPIADWFKKGLKGIKDSLGRNAPNGSGVNRWRDQVKDALKANGMSTDDWAVNKILKQISTESGGNEKAVQGGYTDVNTKTGDLAKGLMQTISATFKRYAHPGHNNIFNGYDNLLAAIAYIKNRYGTNMSGIGEGHGYAEGGWANKPSIFGEVPGQPEVAINPSKPNADQLIVEAMQARAEKSPNGFSAAMLKMANGVKSNSRPADGSLGVTSTNGSVIGKKSDSSQGNVNVSFNIDSTEVARKTYPMIKFLQNSDIQLNARTRGGSYGTL